MNIVIMMVILTLSLAVSWQAAVRLARDSLSSPRLGTLLVTRFHPG